MNLNELIINTLKPLNVPVSFHKNIEKENCYITFFVYNQKGELYSEGEEIETGYYIQVDVWSKGNYIDIVKQVKQLLKYKGFIRQNEYDLYESDTNIYHKCIRFFYLNNKRKDDENGNS